MAAAAAAAVLLALPAAGCGGPAPDQRLAIEIASALLTLCPAADPSDEEARARCAAGLSSDAALRASMAAPFLWGAQDPSTSGTLEDSATTRFDPLVFRRTYLSLMMFPSAIRIEAAAGGVTILHVPVLLRNELAMGSYPHPLWYSQAEWASYQLARELVVVLRDGKWVGALRSADQDDARALVEHTWSGQWTWTEGGEEMPYVSRYGYLLSPANPSAGRLDAAYRALAGGLTRQSCMLCHAPDNYPGARPLDILNYPNQALASRSSIVADLQANSMPPANDLGLPEGIADEGARQELLDLAREFAAAGDAALAYEGESAPTPGP
jgi:hypothetical protein